MAALDNNFLINSPTSQTHPYFLAENAYQRGRDNGLSDLEAIYAMKDGPMGLSRELLSVTGGADMRGRIHDYTRDGILAAPFFARNLMPPPAQAAPAALAQSPAGPQPRPALVHPKPHMQSAIANDPLLQLMAGGNKQRLGPQETLYFYNSLDPAAQKQHAARIDGSHLAGLEERDAMGPPPMYGNLDGTVYGTGSDTPVLESADPIDELQELYAAQNNAQSNPDRSYRDMSQGAQDARGALASVNTGTSGELPVLASVPDRSGSNSLTNLLSGLTYDAIGYFTGTSAEDVRANGISVIHNGKEIFAVDGLGNTAPITPEQAAAIQAENSGGGEQQQQNGPYFPEMPVAPPALTSPSTETGTGTGALTVKGSQNAQQPVNRVRASTGGYTGNARGSGLPDMQIGLGERLMRMGMAGLANASQGSLAQMGAMTGAYNDVNQANRQAEMGNFKIEEARRQAHADRVAKLAAAKNKGMGDIKDYQGKNFGFYNRGVDAERVLGKLEEQGTDFWKTVGSKVPLFGNKLVGAEYRQYDQARRNFVNAVLRRESGAVISDAEFENANIQYFPVFGDGEAEIAQKRENRRTTMLGIRSGTGSAMQFTSSYPSSGTVQIGGATITPIAAQ